MKRILSSTIQVFRQIGSGPMMFITCLTPFVMGTLVKFGIPFLEGIADFSLQAYYPIFDLLLSIMAPVLFCFAFVMVTLEKIGDEVSRYFSVTPLGKLGYLFTRLGIPAVISAVIAFIILLFFSLEKLPVGVTVSLAFLDSVQAIIVSLMIITLSTNKLGSMTVTKLSAPTLLSIPVPFFIEGVVQYIVGFLPSFRVGEAMQSNGYTNLLITLLVASIWSYVSASKLIKKLAGQEVIHVAWYWWLILIGVLTAVGLLKVVVIKKYNQKKNSNNRPEDYEDG